MLVLVIQALMGNAYLPLAALAVVGVLGVPLALGLPARPVRRRSGGPDWRQRAARVATLDGER